MKASKHIMSISIKILYILILFQVMGHVQAAATAGEAGGTTIEVINPFAIARAPVSAGGAGERSIESTNLPAASTVVSGHPTFLGRMLARAETATVDIPALHGVIALGRGLLGRDAPMTAAASAAAGSNPTAQHGPGSVESPSLGTAAPPSAMGAAAPVLGFGRVLPAAILLSPIEGGPECVGLSHPVTAAPPPVMGAAAPVAARGETHIFAVMATEGEIQNGSAVYNATYHGPPRDVSAMEEAEWGAAPVREMRGVGGVHAVPIQRPPHHGSRISAEQHLRNIAYAGVCGGCIYSNQCWNNIDPVKSCIGRVCCPCAVGIGALVSGFCAPVWAAATPCTDNGRRSELNEIVTGKPVSPLLVEFFGMGLFTSVRYY